MNRLLVSLGMALFAAVVLLAPVAPRADADVQELTPDQVEKLLGAADVRVYDVNNLDLFTKSHVPGAVHVGNKKLDSLLPSDKSTRLVFYCANTLWSSSHHAARAAAKNGYRNVFVMSEGIQGWVKAGKKVQTGGG